jgi:hypothetical protein
MDVNTIERFLKSLISRNEVLRILSVSAPTLREWERQGKLTPIRIGGRVYFHVLEISSLIKFPVPDVGAFRGGGHFYKKEESDER